MLSYARAIWAYRHFILATIRAEFMGRFYRSRLGALWHILNPLAQGAIFAFVLSEVLQARLGVSGSKSAYAVYLLAGTAAWSFFSELVNRSAGVFVEYGGQLKKIAFPRIALPVIVWGGSLLNHLLLLAAIVLIILFLGYWPNTGWGAILLGALLLSLLGIGLGLLLGVFNVFARDISQVLAVVMQLWFWLTPIVYPIGALPEGYRWLAEINPMTPIVGLYQNALLGQPLPALTGLVPITVLAVGFLILSFFVFRKASPEIVDAL